MEINNNDSLYLHKCEDKGDKKDKRMQCENKISQSTTTVATSLKHVESSQSGKVEIKTMSVEKADVQVITVALSSDIDESPVISEGEEMTQPADNIENESSKIAENFDEKINESAETGSNNNEMITSDSAELDDDEVNQLGITISKSPLIIEPEAAMTHSKGESEVIFTNATRLSANIEQ